MKHFLNVPRSGVLALPDTWEVLVLASWLEQLFPGVHTNELEGFSLFFFPNSRLSSSSGDSGQSMPVE